MHVAGRNHRNLERRIHTVVQLAARLTQAPQRQPPGRSPLTVSQPWQLPARQANRLQQR